MYSTELSVTTWPKVAVYFWDSIHNTRDQCTPHHGAAERRRCRSTAMPARGLHTPCAQAAFAQLQDEVQYVGELVTSAESLSHRCQTPANGRAGGGRALLVPQPYEARLRSVYEAHGYLGRGEGVHSITSHCCLGRFHLTGRICANSSRERAAQEHEHAAHQRLGGERRGSEQCGGDCHGQWSRCHTDGLAYGRACGPAGRQAGRQAGG